MRRIEEAAALTLFSFPHMEMEAAIAPSSGTLEASYTMSYVGLGEADSLGTIGSGAVAKAGVAASVGIRGFVSAGRAGSTCDGTGVCSDSGWDAGPSAMAVGSAGLPFCPFSSSVAVGSNGCTTGAGTDAAGKRCAVQALIAPV